VYVLSKPTIDQILLGESLSIVSIRCQYLSLLDTYQNKKKALAIGNPSSGKCRFLARLGECLAAQRSRSSGVCVALTTSPIIGDWSRTKRARSRLSGSGRRFNLGITPTPPSPQNQKPVEAKKVIPTQQATQKIKQIGYLMQFVRYKKLMLRT